MRYNSKMKDDVKRPAEWVGKGYTIGRRRFAKISAIDGIRLSAEMEADFREFDRKGLLPVERRRLLAEKYGKAR